MPEAIFRPVTLPPQLVGQPAPCDFFDARGTLLLRAGIHIEPRAASSLRSRRVFCEASHAERLVPGDPVRQLREVGRTLSGLAEAAIGGGTDAVRTGDFTALARRVYESWQLDADACLGYVRLSQFDRPSVCHAVRGALLAAELAAAGGLPEQESADLIGAALTMNLSSMRLHDDMFESPGAPDEAARRAIRAHPAGAATLLKRIGTFPRGWLDAVALHHENIDGSGYPHGLARTDIPLSARMLRVADVLAARLVGRRRRAPRHWGLHQTRDPQRLIEHVFGNDLRRLDPNLVRSLMSRLGAFPPGSLVRLSNGELAVVSRRHTERGEAPRDVLAFLGIDGRPLASPHLRRLDPRGCRIQAYAHDELPRLPPYAWQRVWGYRH